MVDRPLMKESLFFLNIIGIHPNKFDVLSILRASIITIAITLNLINTFLKCIFHWEGTASTEVLAGLFGTYLTLLKLLTILIYRKSYSRLISVMEEFWPSDRYGEQLDKEIQFIYRIMTTIFKVLTVTLSALLPAYLIHPIVSSSRELFAEGYYTDNLTKSPQYEIVMVIQFIYIISGCVSVLGFDGMLISLIVHVTSQLKLIKLGFEKVPINSDIEEETKEELNNLYEVIDHHILVLEYIKDIRKLHSGILLNIYLCNMITICAGLMGIVADGFPPEPQRLYQYGLYLLFYLMELLFYCMTGTYMANECKSVSDAVYNSDWHVKRQATVRKACLFVILRAQREENLTAGGMFDINLNSFTNIINNAFSAFTLMNAIYGTEQ